MLEYEVFCLIWLHPIVVGVGTNGDHQGHSLQDKEKLSHGGLQQFLFSSLIGCLVITCPSCLFHVYSRIFLVCLYIEVVFQCVRLDYVDEWMKLIEQPLFLKIFFCFIDLWSWCFEVIPLSVILVVNSFTNHSGEILNLWFILYNPGGFAFTVYSCELKCFLYL